MEVFLEFMGEAFIAEVDYDVKSYGAPAHMGSLTYPGDPGDPPEFDILSITLRRDLPCIGRDKAGRDIYPMAPEFEATGALFDCLCNHEPILEAISVRITEDGPPEYYDY